jgi:hypothetical protein
MICWSATTARVSEYRSHRHRDKPARISRLSPRHIGLYLYGILFFVLLVLLQVRLSEWDESAEGHCYNPYLLTNTNAQHPTADMVYVGFTGCWLLASLAMAVFGRGVRMLRRVLVLALLQLPLHLYMMIVLRVANTHALQGEHSENEWSFGQTVAVVLFGVTVRELMAGLRKYAFYNRTVRERRARAGADLEARRGEKREEEEEV